MTRLKRGTAGMAVLMALFEAMSAPAVAEPSFPNRLVTIVVPVPAGPIIDVVPRIIAQKLSARWGHPVIVENRPGASSMIGAEYVSKAAPDGYTLLLAPPNPVVQAQHFFPKLGYDPAAFTPVTLMFRLPLLWVANPKIPVASFSELVAYGKENPGKLTFGSAGQGSDPHIRMLELMSITGANFTHVPYRSFPTAFQDVMAGRVDLVISGVPPIVSLLSANKLKALVVTGPERVAALPDVPTMKELGYDDLTFVGWFGLFAPAGTPQAIIDSLNDAAKQISQQSVYRERFEKIFKTLIDSESTRMGNLIKKVGVAIEQ